jgi:hypothetical protein
MEVRLTVFLISALDRVQWSWLLIDLFTPEIGVESCTPEIGVESWEESALRIYG